MDVFDLRQKIVHEYSEFVRSFVKVKEPRLLEFVEQVLKDEALWPQPLIQMNPSFEPGGWIDDLVAKKLIHPECGKVFRGKKNEDQEGKKMLLHRHQVEAIEAANRGESYVLTTGTGSGKSLAYIIPIVDHILRQGKGKGIKAIVVYPMNALCNSQFQELEKFLTLGYPEGNGPVRFCRYTGQESLEDRDAIIQNPPDILLTNYVMLELMLTRVFEKQIIKAARDMRFLVLDELHTYRGRQGADVAFLVRRLREATGASNLLCVGTSATMATGGTFAEKQQAIAQTATRMFGTNVPAHNIIGETLRRATTEMDFSTPENIKALRADIQKKEIPVRYSEFVSSTMASWLEDSFGLVRKEDRLERAPAQALSGDDGIVNKLEKLTGIGRDECLESIRTWLLAGYKCEANAQTGFRPFAFRLHQFISRGESVYSTLETPSDRFNTLSGQKFAPNSTENKLFPLSFCRECGADFYTVYLIEDPEKDLASFYPRILGDRNQDENDGIPGFLFQDPANPWPQSESDPDLINRVPTEWIDEQADPPTILKSQRQYLPQNYRILPNGDEEPGTGNLFTFMEIPFRFCPCCKVSYKTRRNASDYARLTNLSAGGRSTATTLLNLFGVQYLRGENTLPDSAKKILTFTDNRQDASLQAGHFNDFIDVSILRSGLYRAVKLAGAEGISHDDLPRKIFEALNLPFHAYGYEENAKFLNRTNTEKAFRNLLAHRVYRDLKRGWRVTSPNLEQCGLLKIEYPSLNELCAADEEWKNCHPALVTASAEVRNKICVTLLDHIRRELAIDVEFLSYEFLEKLRLQSQQQLVSPWALDEKERLEQASIAFPRSRSPHDRENSTYISSRGGFGTYLVRQTTFTNWNLKEDPLKLPDRDMIIKNIFDVLKEAGFLVRVVFAGNDKKEDFGYRIKSSAMTWIVGDGKIGYHDNIRVPNAPGEGIRANPFFVNFYSNVAGNIKSLHSREHTAQVRSQDRESREKDFRSGKLPVLFCSPTMELGVDISDLNVVNMRNVPPTPANYAQRSGRAGRSGQPALVFTYCTAGNAHDQYFFRRQERMVSGAVTPPKLDLANEDLVRAHVHAIWLGATGANLRNSLSEILDIKTENPTLALEAGLKADLELPSARVVAFKQIQAILAPLQQELSKVRWFHDDWVKNVINNALNQFEEACERWRSLFRAAKSQIRIQASIIGDASRPQIQRDDAKRRRTEAENQIELLTDVKNVVQSDFYSYRYFASEGFLPGYNFPRLPLSAYIPGRRKVKGDSEYLSRPRFLAISEFGPLGIIYHEGARYKIKKVLLSLSQEDVESTDAASITISGKTCLRCGYLFHSKDPNDLPNLCTMCNSPNLEFNKNFLRMQNVSAQRHDRINCDEEERLKVGYEIATGFRFKEINGKQIFRVGNLMLDGTPILKLTYGDGATIWRMNMGWRRRKDQGRKGFSINLDTGDWLKQNAPDDDEDDIKDEPAIKAADVIPYVDDRRNCLLIDIPENWSDEMKHSFSAAFKKGIQAEFQLEDNELALEELPDSDVFHRLLIYESAEGGAGVLRRILDESDSFAKVSAEALRICHYDPDTMEDKRRTAGVQEECSVACYDCLMGYGNQADHKHLNRHAVAPIFKQLMDAKLDASPGPSLPSEHLELLYSLTGSDLEREWLKILKSFGLNYPSHAQKLLKDFSTRPDFLYEKERTCIYIDGPVHDFPERHKRDLQQESELIDGGYIVIRFHHKADWEVLFVKYPSIFGKIRKAAEGT